MPVELSIAISVTICAENEVIVNVVWNCQFTLP